VSTPLTGALAGLRRAGFGAACWAALAALTAAAPAARSSSGDAPARSGPVPVASSASETAGPLAEFRFGTAARPFGWSTALGDFNADGAPDLAVADRVARRPEGFGYRLRVSVSGLSSRDVAFVSRHAALTVRAVDVDHDRDVDLVVSAVPSGELVAVWLNDGRGRFTESNVSRLPAVWSSDDTLDSGDPRSGVSLSAEAPRRAADALAVARARAPSPEPRPLPPPQPARRHTRDVSSATGPRAPPLSTLSHLA
jgi:hypothetical protein